MKKVAGQMLLTTSAAIRWTTSNAGKEQRHQRISESKGNNKNRNNSNNIDINKNKNNNRKWCQNGKTWKSMRISGWRYFILFSTLNGSRIANSISNRGCYSPSSCTLLTPNPFSSPLEEKLCIWRGGCLFTSNQPRINLTFNNTRITEVEESQSIS